jgi:COP9 signalosome complex subunit 8
MDITLSNYEQQLAALEEQELESDDDPSINLYTQLLALYVLTDDLPSARLLWKRIPDAMKHPEGDVEPDLVHVWRLASLLIQKHLKDIPEVYNICHNRVWPPFVKKIIAQIAVSTRQRMVNLITSAYSHITLIDLAKLTGCSTEKEARTLVTDLGWTFDPSSPAYVVVPKKVAPTPSTSNGHPVSSFESFDSGDADEEEVRDGSNHEQLHRLTEYVAFLENH